MRPPTSNRKATHRQLRRHNQQLILRAIYNGVADNRAALAQETRLTKPTVSDLVSELIDEGLLVEVGRGESTGEGGGRRPRLLEFVPEARHVIGISVNGERVLGALGILDGRIIARHRVELSSARGDGVVDCVVETINGLLAQLDAPLLSIGVGVSGVVDAAQGVVGYAPHLGWHNLPLAALLETQYRVPIYIANSTELAAMAQFVFGMTGDITSLATVLISTGVGVGLVINGMTYPGGGEIGHLRVADHSRIDVLPEHEGQLETFLGWHYVRQRAHALRVANPAIVLPGKDGTLTYLHIRQAVANGDPAALALQGELARSLAQVFAWIIGLLRPDHVALAGPITDLGPTLLDSAVAYTRDLILSDLVDRVAFSLAEGTHLVTMGAIAQALQLELGVV